jgi:hypothetical protein
LLEVRASNHSEFVVGCVERDGAPDEGEIAQVVECGQARPAPTWTARIIRGKAADDFRSSHMTCSSCSARER